MHGEQEHSILANVPRERIQGAFQMETTPSGRLKPGAFRANPNYVPLK
jgi:hypothetical protein